MAQKEMTRITEERISEIISRIEMYGHGAGYTADEVLEIAQQMLALRQKEQHESNTCGLNFEQWLEQQRGKIDVDCGCVSTETFMHWLRVAYEAGNRLDTHPQEVPKPRVSTTLERSYLETALKIKAGHTLGVIDAMLVHEMARALLPLVAEKHEADHANES